LRDDGFLSLSFFLWLAIGLALLIAFAAASSNSARTKWFGRGRGMLAAGGAVASFAVVMAFGLQHLPHVTEAAARNLQAIAGWAEVLAAAFGAGVLIRRLWGGLFEDARERFLFTLGMGIGALALASLGLAISGWYIPGTVTWLIRILEVVAVGSLVRQLLHQKKILAVSPPGPEARETPWSVLWKSIAALAALMGLVGALAPESEFDALWYHLWLPKLWLESGSPVDLVQEYVSLYPLNLDLVFGAAMVMGGPLAAKLVHFSCYLLTGSVVFATLRRFSAASNAWMATALYLTIPTVLWEATTAYVDNGLAFFVALSAYALLRFPESKRTGWLVVAGAMAGIGLGIKHLALLALGGQAAGIVIWTWVKRKSPLGGLLTGGAFLLMALLIASPWYIRSYMASGNPVFPDLYQVFGAEPPERWSPESEAGLAQFKSRFGVERSATKILLLPWTVTTEGNRFAAAFGPLLLVFLIPLLSGRCRDLATTCLAFVAIVYVALWASPLSSFQGRFLLPIMPLLAVLAGSGYGLITQALSQTSWGRVRAALNLTLALLLVMNLPPFISLHEGSRVGWTGWLPHVTRQVPDEVVAGRITEDQYLREKVPSYAAWQYINRSLSSDARVLTFSEGDNFYAERERLWSESTVATPAVRGSVGKGDRYVFEQIERLGITHILFDNRRLPQDSSLGLPVARAIGRWCQPVYQDARFTLCEVRWEDPAGGWGPERAR
jgi:hypothetical protein